MAFKDAGYRIEGRGILEIRCGISRARDTYGYNIVTLYADDRRVASCMGGGYDMRGTVFGDWFKEAYQSELKQIWTRASSISLMPDYRRLDGDIKTLWGDTVLQRDLYGMRSYVNDSTREIEKVGIDGASGESSVRNIIEACGFHMEWCYKNHWLFSTVRVTE